MDSFNLKKYLAEGRLFEENTQALLREIKVGSPSSIPPSGWDEIRDLSDFNDDYGMYPIEVLKAWEAPMEGWDDEHMDIVMIKKQYPYNPGTHWFKDEGKFYVDGYVAFGDFDDKGPFDTFEEALYIAVKEMEAFKEEWK
jgi:hypothetical protein